MIWFTSDTHFGHGNIIKYCNRPFMNDYEQSIVNAYIKSKNSWKWTKESPDQYGNSKNTPEEEAYFNLKISKETVDKHDAVIIDNINKVVDRDDRLYHLGDFTLRNFEFYRNRINCKRIHLILGNHDRIKLSERSLFSSVSGLKEINYNGQYIVMCHYAMRVWNKHNRGSWMLFGHSHNTLPPIKNSFDVGIDCHEYKPLNINNVRKIVNENNKKQYGHS